MDPFEDGQLADPELDALLAEWHAPQAPASLRSAVFRPWWSRMWTASIRIPLPAACCLAALLAAALWHWSRPVPVRVIVRTERVEVPVVKEQVVTRLVYRDRPVPLDIHELQPVAVLRPVIIRSGYDRK
jgi:hypothetical protein